MPEMQQVSPLLTPIVQYGFAGFSTILLIFIAWLTKILIQLQKDTIEAVKANTQVIATVLSELTKQTETLDDLRDRILQRPCIAYKQND